MSLWPAPHCAVTHLCLRLVTARDMGWWQLLPKPSLESRPHRTPSRLLSANLGKPQSRLTACQGTADALTGLPP